MEKAVAEMAECERAAIYERAHTGDVEFKFIRNGRSFHAMVDKYDLMGEDRTRAAVQQAASAARNWLDKNVGPLKPGSTAPAGPPHIFRTIKIVLNGKVYEMPEDEMPEEEAKTVSERFDRLQATIQAINTNIARRRVPHVCQIWADVIGISGKEAKVISDERYSPEKFIYTDKGTIKNMALVMKPEPDENGKIEGEEILLGMRDLDDCFPDLYATLNAEVTLHGYRDLKAFTLDVESLVGGRREIARALIDMSHATLTTAREAAVEQSENERTGFYDSQKEFGQF